MEIKKAKEKDFVKIVELVQKEFPYTLMSVEKLKNRIETKNIHLFKLEECGKFLGFIELEILNSDEAMINGFAVVEEERGRKLGKKLLGFGINFLKEKGIKRVFLLVRESNERAKALYKEFGFEFIGLYHKKIGEETIEELELDLSDEKETPKYIS